jgi:hypothetical protein
MNLSLKNIVIAIIALGGTVLAHHIGGKIYCYHSTKEAEKTDAIINQNVLDRLKTIEEKVEKGFENQDIVVQANKIAQNCNDKMNSLTTNMENNQAEAIKDAENVQNCIKELTDLLSSINNNNFKFSLNLDSYYAYLDSLSLLEEAALLHIFIFLFILLTLFNLISILFVNEIIKYFKLEDKPYLNKVLTLRLKFQKYYLIWNFIILILICLGALFLNLFIFN